MLRGFCFDLYPGHFQDLGQTARLEWKQKRKAPEFCNSSKFKYMKAFVDDKTVLV